MKSNWFCGRLTVKRMFLPATFSWKEAQKHVYTWKRPPLQQRGPFAIEEFVVMLQ